MLKTQIVEILSEEDIAKSQQTVGLHADELGLNSVERTKITTAASEIAHNTLIYGGGGTLRLEAGELNGRVGLRLVFEDRGPGIPDIATALQDGYTSGNGLGFGLGGAKRLADEFAVESTSGGGTRVTLTHWKS